MRFTITLVALAAALASAKPLHKRQANIQTFDGALGGVAATPVVDSGNADRPFQVKDATFVNIGAALQRSCDQQFNGCANIANANGQADFSVSDCQAQKNECDTASDAIKAGGAPAAGNNNQGNQGNQAPACPAKRHRRRV